MSGLGGVRPTHTTHITPSRGDDALEALLASATPAPAPVRSSTAPTGRSGVIASIAAGASSSTSLIRGLPDIDMTKPSPPPPAKPVDVKKHDAWKTLAPALREEVLARAADPVGAAQLQVILANPHFQQYKLRRQMQVLDVFARCDDKGVRELPALLNRRIQIGCGDPAPTMPAISSGDNTSKQTLAIDHLVALAHQELEPGLEGRRAELLGALVSDLAEPSLWVDQGYVGTCVSTTTQLHLILHTPSEYARIVAGLASKDRGVSLADGTRLDAALNDVVPAGTATNGPAGGSDARTLTDRIFQSAFQQEGMQAGGRDDVFDVESEWPGLWYDEERSVLSALYGREFHVEPEGGKGFGTLEVGSFAAERQALADSVQRQLDIGWGPVPVGMIWGNGGVASGLHMLLVTDVHDGRVYIRNPWGSAKNQGEGYTDGLEIAGPPARRVEKATSAVESMTLEEFARLLDSVVAGPPIGSAPFESGVWDG